MWSDQFDSKKKKHGPPALELCSRYAKAMPDSDWGTLGTAGNHLMHKKPRKAEAVLQAFIDSHPKNCLRVQLTLAQIRLQQSQLGGAIQCLRGVDLLEEKLGVVATLVGLLKRARDFAGALALLDDAIKHNEGLAQTPETQQRLTRLLQVCGTLRLQQKQHEEAAHCFRRAAELSPDDKALTAGLVLALAHTNVDDAEKHVAKLPSDTIDPRGLQQLLDDSEALSEIAVPRARREAKKRKAEEEAMDEPAPKKRKKKQRLRHPPAVMDGNADPERWVPLRLRSTYKKLSKKAKKRMQQQKKRDEEQQKRGGGPA